MIRLLTILLAASAWAADYDAVAQRYLAARAQAVAAVTNAEQARERQNQVRAKILELIGGLPDYKGPLNAKVTGTLERRGYTIEKVMFESLPNVFVTANVYRPSGNGPFPAVLMPLGHWDQGKSSSQLLAANLALKGFIAMPYDPLGQGERQQAYDSRAGGSLIGGSVDQHFLAGAQAILVGQSYARYRIWDGVRALDYLVSRRDVDAKRIGVTGCSGGGTVTAYLSALDDRVEVAAPACYITSFVQLFSGDIGDSEQSIPGFLSSGLDQADWVELFAPKPYLICSTEKDFFPIEGSRQAYREARRWYGLFGDPERISMFIGEGGHGTPRQTREAIYAWMIRWLKAGKGEAGEIAVETLPDADLHVTPGGQVPGRDISAYIAETPLARGTRTELEAAVARWVTAKPGGCGAPHAGSPALVAIGGAGEPAKGHVKAAMVRIDDQPRGFPGRWESSTRAMLVGRNLPGDRASEIIQRVDQLCSMPDVDPARIGVAAEGPDGVAALLAAIVDRRIAKVWLERTPISYRSAFLSPIHRDLYEGLIPGFALRWDLEDLVALAGPGRVVWLDPTDWNGRVVHVEGPYSYRSPDFSEDAARWIPGWR